MLKWFAAFACTAAWHCGSAAQVTVTVTDQAGAPVSDAVVALRSEAVSASGNQSKPTVALDQVNKRFVPHVSVIEVGTTLYFPNSDNIRHQVYSFSDAKRFELKLYAGKSAAPVLFDRPGVVVLGCNIHDWMSAYVYVVATPYFAMTNNEGRAVIKVPLGTYVVETWHPRHAQGREAASGEILVMHDAEEKRLALALAAVDDSPGIPP